MSDTSTTSSLFQRVVPAAAVFAVAAALGAIALKQRLHAGRKAVEDKKATDAASRPNPKYPVLWPPGMKLSWSVFEVTPENGFLPRQEPLRKLPPDFAALQSILDRLPKLLHDASNPDAVRTEVRVPMLCTREADSGCT